LKNSFAICVKDIKKQGLEFSNLYAPEHLILATTKWKDLISEIKNAGSVFCGNFSAESFGDYASGTNHTLPTGGFAKSYSGISVESFGKWISFQEININGLKNLGPKVEVMANTEGLEAHKQSISIRLTEI
jgi:histidinol dehydrogenase